jgi:hypothetical protein|eukprot:COSAG01_NODE_2621_length_7361_cov_3.608510_7_plen_75_part_00
MPRSRYLKKHGRAPFPPAPNEVIGLIAHDLRGEIFCPASVIVRPGELGRRLFFLKKGIVEMRGECRPAGPLCPS